LVYSWLFPSWRLPGACGGNNAFAKPIFTDRTADTGINFSYHKRSGSRQFGHYGIAGRGVALIDYDQDGLLDIFVPGGGYYDGPDKKQIKGHPCKLYKNLGNWQFRDVTAEAGLNIDWFYTTAGAVADYDNDGWPDLLVTGWAVSRFFTTNQTAKAADALLMSPKKPA